MLFLSLSIELLSCLSYLLTHSNNSQLVSYLATNCFGEPERLATFGGPAETGYAIEARIGGAAGFFPSTS